MTGQEVIFWSTSSIYLLYHELQTDVNAILRLETYVLWVNSTVIRINFHHETVVKNIFFVRAKLLRLTFIQDKRCHKQDVYTTVAWASCLHVCINLNVCTNSGCFHPIPVHRCKRTKSFSRSFWMRSHVLFAFYLGIQKDRKKLFVLFKLIPWTFDSSLKEII